MKKTELRIGNLVSMLFDFPDEPVHIWGTNHDSEILQDWEYVKPIPLTEEWLLKFGFWRWTKGSRSWIVNELFLEKTGQMSHRFYLTTIDKKYAIKVGLYAARTGYYPSTHLRYIKYVHQLQNLYFALTGKELTINF